MEIIRPFTMDQDIQELLQEFYTIRAAPRPHSRPHFLDPRICPVPIPTFTVATRAPSNAASLCGCIIAEQATESAVPLKSKLPIKKEGTLQAQASKAKVIGLANAGGDTINSIKQAGEFGIVAGGQKLAGLLVFLSDIHSLGLKVAQGLTITSAWYWDKDDPSRAFAKRFMARNSNGLPPTYIQAGIYTEVAFYLKAIQAAGTDNADKVVAQMRTMKINDFMTKNGWLREDGRVMRDMYLEEVKSPAESKYRNDYVKILTTIPAEEAFRPLKEGGCPFVHD